MTSNYVVLLTVSMLALACSQPAGPPLTISNVVVLEPLPGMSIAAGYLVLENNSDQQITIERITSPQFARIEMHETVIRDDVARMVSLSSLVVERQSNIVFEPGGKHLMLFASSSDITPGLPVTIEFHHDLRGLLIVATTVSSRDDTPE